ncbi:putative Na+/H+ antiporter [Chlamydia pecorum]|uniref:putative Na+/H+ antiporter n=1 Tax=Chlamydia pecorum TaxID=85991 RepID=UPI00388E1227
MILAPYSSSLKLGATIIFVCSIIHMFLTPRLRSLAQKYENKKVTFPRFCRQYQIFSELYKCLGRIEIVFIFWAVPLFLWFLYTEGYKVTMSYFNSRNYNSAMFIIIMFLLLESRPIVHFSERFLSFIAKVGNTSPTSWWWTLMIATPLLSFLLKEGGAMIIGATLLVRHFFIFSPSQRLAYATLGLLFSNISIGGLSSSISSRALLAILPSLKWGSGFVFKYFAWKAVITILISTTLCYLVFRKEFCSFPKLSNQGDIKGERVPWWIIGIHIILIALAIHARFATLFMMAILLFYIGFQRFTIFYQTPPNFSKACLVGLFYVGMVIFGDLQEWWVLELMHGMSDFGYMMTSYTLSIFLDNALVNYLVHNLSVATDCYLYLVIIGSMSAGGLTLLANMPNIIGYLIIRPAFQNSSISQGKLFLAALGPSLISLSVFWILKDVPTFLFCFFR